MTARSVYRGEVTEHLPPNKKFKDISRLNVFVPLLPKNSDYAYNDSCLTNELITLPNLLRIFRSGAPQWIISFLSL